MQTRGFSLIELLVAVVFIGGSLAGVIYLHGKLTLENLHAQSLTVATSLANDKMAEARAMSYADIAVENNQTENSSVNNIVYTRNWTTTEYTSPNYKMLQISVQWTDINGKTNSLYLASAIAEVNQAEAYL